MGRLPHNSTESHSRSRGCDFSNQRFSPFPLGVAAPTAPLPLFPDMAAANPAGVPIFPAAAAVVGAPGAWPGAIFPAAGGGGGGGDGAESPIIVTWGSLIG